MKEGFVPLYFFVEVGAAHEFESIDLFHEEDGDGAEGEVHLGGDGVSEVVLEEEVVIGMGEVEDLGVGFGRQLWRLIHFVRKVL